MKITKITHNLRANGSKPTQVDFADITFITGDNMRGKTTVLDAVSLAIGGYIPRHGKSNAKLASVIGSGSDRAQVEAKLSDGQTIKWSLSQTKSGSLTKKADKVNFSQIIIDPEMFFTAKPNERISAIQSALGIKIDIVRELAKGVPSACASNKTEAGEWISETTAMLKDEIKQHSDNIKRQASTIQGITQHADEDARDYSAELEEARKRLLEVSREIGQKTAMLQAANKQADAVSHQIEELRRSPCDYPSGAIYSEKDLDVAKKAVRASRELGQAAANAEFTLAEMSEDAEADVCSHCGASKTHWSTHHLTNLSAKIQELRMTARSGPTDEEHDILVKRLADIERHISDQQKAEDYEAEMDQQRSLAVDISLRVKSLEEQIADLNKSERISTSRISALEGMAEKCAESLAAKKLMERCVNESEHSERLKSELATVLADLQSRVLELSQRIMGPVVDKANLFTKGILRGDLVASGFDIGYSTTDGDFVPLDGFSGTERIAASAGIQAALMLDTDPRVVMIDEFQRVTGTNAQRLIYNLADAIENGVIDQAIIAGSGIDKPSVRVTGCEGVKVSVVEM